MNLIKFIVLLAVAIGTIVSAKAYDNGPEVVACDYKLGNSEGTDKCLILGSGMGQGISWTVFEVMDKRFRYNSSEPNSMELLNSANETINSYSINNSTGQCRPGGNTADRYSFTNGDRICLYW